VVKRSRGFSLIEIVVALAIFALLLLILVGLESQLVRFDRHMRIELFTHPEPAAVLARVRRDVLDSVGYPGQQGEWTQTATTLLLNGLDEDGKPVVIVYDFSKANTAHRLAYHGNELFAEWSANNVPAFTIDAVELPRGETAVRLTALDNHGRVAIDQIITPRASSE
jgi:prepilin-type N-terminal cleavage/methylation domain-containing protein